MAFGLRMTGFVLGKEQSTTRAVDVVVVDDDGNKRKNAKADR